MFTSYGQMIQPNRHPEDVPEKSWRDLLDEVDEARKDAEYRCERAADPETTWKLRMEAAQKMVDAAVAARQEIAIHAGQFEKRRKA